MKQRTMKTIYDYTDLLKCLDYEKNISEGIDPHKVYSRTSNNLWFKTPNGIQFKRQIVVVVRNYLKFGKLPYEFGLAIPGYNDVLTTDTDIRDILDMDRNEKEGIDLTRYLRHSGVRVYAKCTNCGKAIENKRYLFSIVKNRSAFCDRCSKSTRTSFQEQTIYYYVKKMPIKSLNCERSTLGNNLELDIYLPDYKIGIEYDGFTWHKDKRDADIRKYNVCKSLGIYLIRVSDITNDDQNADMKIFVHHQPNNEDYKKIIGVIAEKTNQKRVDVDIERDRYDIIKSYKNVIYEKSFGFRFPECLKYWDFEKNCGISPYNISANDINDYWFKDEYYGSYRKQPNMITSGKSLMIHPKRAYKNAGMKIRVSVIAYEIESGKIQEGDYESMSKLTGLAVKSLSRMCLRGHNGGNCITSDKKYLIMYKKDYSDDRVSVILGKLLDKDGKISTIPHKWTRDRCREVALKCDSLQQFRKNHNGAYKSSETNGWLQDYDWLKKQTLQV